MLEKRIILNINNVYTANAFNTPEGVLIGAGSETDPDVRLYDLSQDTYESIPGCPGGLMSFVPVPGQSNAYVTIMGLFPPFKGKEAGLYLHSKTATGWNTVKTMEFPFAHRCEFINRAGHHFLVAAAVSKFKENPDDWSLPGVVHLIDMDKNPDPQWKSKIIDSIINRNHGMTRTEVGGTETICVSGTEGIFYLETGDTEPWQIIPLFNNEVSEMTFIDLNGDGAREMVTVEPFHGNTLNIYKHTGSVWKLLFQDSISFGHGLSSGIFNGEPIIVVGSRRDSMALDIFTINDLAKGSVNRKLIEKGAGPTQTQVFSAGNTDYILSANQRKNEVALYTGSLD